MKALTLSCLVSLVVVTSLVDTAEAGRRRRRRSGAVASAAASSVVRREAIATAVSRPAVEAATNTITTILPFQAIAAPDLTITSCKDEDDIFLIEIHNKGQASAQATYVQLEFTHPEDATMLAMQKVLIAPLEAGQVTTLQLSTYGLNKFPFAVHVDPDNSVVEISEKNNMYSPELEKPPLPPRPVSMEKLEEIMEPLLDK